VTNLSLANPEIATLDVDAVVIGVVSNDSDIGLAPGAESVDRAFGGGLAAVLAGLGATGEPGQVTKVPTFGRLTAPILVAVGLGDAAGAHEAESLRRAAGAGLRSLAGSASVALALPATSADEVTAVAAGALLGNYAYLNYRTGDGHKQPVPDVTVVSGADPGDALRRAEVLAESVSLVRDLVNTPPSDLTPEILAETAEQVGADAGLSVQVLDEKALVEGGYGGIVGVGQGSVNPPRLVRLAYRHPDATRTIAYVGKGITFDSGGLSLKPADSMDWMKSDMGGAAAVLGALKAIARLAPKINVVGYLAIAENMPSGTAQRPSDVITMYGGKTVEVLNTDAEGRLVMADAIVRAGEDDRRHPDRRAARGARRPHRRCHGQRRRRTRASGRGRRARRRSRLAHAPARRAAQGPGLHRRRHRQHQRRALGRHADGRRVPAGVRARRRALGAPRHRRSGLPPRRAVRLHPEGRHGRRRTHARAARGGRRGRRTLAGVRRVDTGVSGRRVTGRCPGRWPQVGRCLPEDHRTARRRASEQRRSVPCRIAPTTSSS
jgi:leucyl aminopeptidase